MMKDIIIQSLCFLVASASLNLLAQNIVSEPLDVNNLKTQINNKGYIDQIDFEEVRAVYSSGFYLSGKDGETIWGNGVFPPEKGMEDYLPGNVGSNPSDSKFKIYIVESSDPDFGLSWQQWEEAVEQGALFYDGDNDGIYNPIDHNGNTVWDPDEDKPDIIGDYTAWCVFNDSRPSDERIYTSVSPKGIEVRQTVFAYDLNHTASLSNTIFVRTIIENKGTVSEQYDSVYFSPVSDPDIGNDYQDDYTGCDTILNSVYAYKKSADSENGYGINPPSTFTTLLQGPHVFIPNVTFVDNNQNGLYDEGIDTALDTAKIRRGELLGIKLIPGAANLSMTAANSFFSSRAALDNPSNEYAQMHYSIGGRFANGEPFTVRELNVGNGASLGEEADDIPPQFMLSGNPVTGEGWLSITKWDSRTMLASGPFVLKNGEEVEIMYSYSVGRGDSALSSITIAKDIVHDITGVYEDNFTNIPVGVTLKPEIPLVFSLLQNYPNPFNPSTKISYSIPYRSQVELRVFDVLGREVSELINREQSAGCYDVNFNASDLSSGLYIYKLQVNTLNGNGNFTQAKKMLLLK